MRTFTHTLTYISACKDGDTLTGLENTKKEIEFDDSLSDSSGSDARDIDPMAASMHESLYKSGAWFSSKKPAKAPPVEVELDDMDEDTR